MKDIPLSRLLDTAMRAAETAGRHAFENKDRRTEANASYHHDIKLVLDVECQKIAEEVIASEFPDHGLLGEEEIRSNDPRQYEWIIDPIDGTMNFTHGFPYWCCSVAVRRNEKVLAGCVYAPEFDDCYTAHIEAPALCNGEPIRISDARDLDKAMVFSGLSKHMKSSDEPHFEMFRMLALSSQKVRITGSAAMDLCQVAAGACDGFLENNLYLWDHAAAGLIAERAGAALSVYPDGDEPYAVTVLCANEHLIKGLLAIYEKCKS